MQLCIDVVCLFMLMSCGFCSRYWCLVIYWMCFIVSVVFLYCSVSFLLFVVLIIYVAVCGCLLSLHCAPPIWSDFSYLSLYFVLALLPLSILFSLCFTLSSILIYLFSLPLSLSFIVYSLFFLFFSLLPISPRFPSIPSFRSFDMHLPYSLCFPFSSFCLASFRRCPY